MKKLTLFLIFLIPITALPTNPPAPDPASEPVAAPIDSMIFLLLTAGILLGGYTVFKKK